MLHLIKVLWATSTVQRNGEGDGMAGLVIEYWLQLKALWRDEKAPNHQGMNQTLMIICMLSHNMYVMWYLI